MEIPIIIHETECGALTLTKERTGWLAEAEMPELGRVVRLKLYGGGQSVYLGIPEPEGGRMRLTKRLKAPDFTPEYCAEEERGQTTSPPDVPGSAEPPTLRHRVWRGGRAYYF